ITSHSALGRTTCFCGESHGPRRWVRVIHQAGGYRDGGRQLKSGMLQPYWRLPALRDGGTVRGSLAPRRMLLSNSRIKAYTTYPRVPDGWLPVPLLPSTVTSTLCLRAAAPSGPRHNSWLLRTIRTKGTPARSRSASCAGTASPSWSWRSFPDSPVLNSATSRPYGQRSEPVNLPRPAPRQFRSPPPMP